MNALERARACLAGQPVDHLPAQPITMTFAARIAGVTYGDYCRDWRVLSQAQLAIVERFGVDMLSLCSDPVREAADCGAPISWFDDQPPSHRPADVLLKDKRDLAKLHQPDPLGGGRMHDRVLGAEYLHGQASGQIPVLGWIEGPLAEAADLRGINEIMLDIVDDPDWVRDLFEFICDMELNFARAQAPYVDIMGIGDAACSLISADIYEQMVAPYQKKLIQGVQSLGIPVRLHICGRTTHLFPGMAELGVDMVDIDSKGDITTVRHHLGNEVTILGNADPVDVLLNGTPETVYQTFEACYQAAGYPFIVGPGCEIPPGSPWENVDAMMQFARDTQPDAV